MSNIFCRPDEVRAAIHGIEHGFPWQETDEGVAFWGNVVDLLRDRLAAELARAADPDLRDLLLNRPQPPRLMTEVELTSLNETIARNERERENFRLTERINAQLRAAARPQGLLRRFIAWIRNIWG